MGMVLVMLIALALLALLAAAALYAWNRAEAALAEDMEARLARRQARSEARAAALHDLQEQLDFIRGGGPSRDR